MWNRLGFRELYTTHILMTALGVSNNATARVLRSCIQVDIADGIPPCHLLVLGGFSLMPDVRSPLPASGLILLIHCTTLVMIPVKSETSLWASLHCVVESEGDLRTNGR